MKFYRLLLAAALAGGMISNIQAAPVSFTTVLGNFENPPTGSGGYGSAVVTLDVIAHTLSIDMSFAGLSSLTTAAHVHCCIAPPFNSGIATQTPTFTGFPASVTSGSYLNTFDTTLASSFRAGFITANGGTPASAEAALFAGLLAGQAYFNIHTSLFPGGEIRGFLAETPEPATLALSGAALVAIALMRRRRSAA